jgi:hypothetical protein
MTLRHAVITVLFLALSGSQALSACDTNCKVAQMIGTWGSPGDRTGYECIQPKPCPGTGWDRTEWGYIIAYEDSSLVKCGVVPSPTEWGPEPTNHGSVSGYVIHNCFREIPGLYGHISITHEGIVRITWGPQRLLFEDRAKYHVWEKRPSGPQPGEHPH